MKRGIFSIALALWTLLLVSVQGGEMVKRALGKDAKGNTVYGYVYQHNCRRTPAVVLPQNGGYGGYSYYSPYVYHRPYGYYRSRGHGYSGLQIHVQGRSGRFAFSGGYHR